MMHTHAKARCYADGGLVQQLRRSVNRLVGNNPEAQKQRGRDPDAIDAPKVDAAAPAAPGYNSGVKTKDNPAGIRFAKGGKVPGKSPTPTADNIPIMATAGEYVLKKAAVDKIGVPALDALNAIGDGGKPASAPKNLRRKAGKQRLAMGGEVAPYVNHRRPKGPPAVPPPLQLGNSAPGPGTAVVEAPYKPNFTMGATPQPPAPQATVTDVRPKFNPDTASKEAKEFLKQRAAAAPQAASPAAAPAAAPTAAPAAAPAAAQPAGPSALRRMATTAAQTIGNNTIVRATGRAAPVIAATNEGLDVARVAADPNASKIDVATQAAEGASRMATAGLGAQAGAALGALTGPAAPILAPVGAVAGGIAGYVGGDALIQKARSMLGLDPASPVSRAPTAVTPAAPTAPTVAATAPAVPAPTSVPVAAAPAPAPEPVPTSQVTRVGNSYSGTNVAGDIRINGADPRGGFVGGTGDGTFTAGGGTGQSAMDAALFQARKAALARGDTASVAASYGGDFGPKPDPVMALMNNGRPMTVKKAEAIASLQRAAGGQAKDTAETNKANLEAKAAQQLLAAQTALTNAKDAGARLKAMDNLRALQGKYEKEFPNRFTVVPGGDEIGPDGFTVFKRPARVIDNQTGQFVDQQQTQALPAGLKVGAPSKQPDGTYSAMGKTVVIKGGKVTEIK